MQTARDFLERNGSRMPDYSILMRLKDEKPEKIFADAFPPHEQKFLSTYSADRKKSTRGPTRAVQDAVFPGMDVNESRMQVILDAQSAARKIEEKGGDAELTSGEVIGLEAVTCIWGRPAILIQDDKFCQPPEGWEILETKRTEIEKNCQSVGRIEVSGHPDYKWVGTGFLVADDVIMTNSHVATKFCIQNNNDKWVCKLGMEGRVDYREELGMVDPAEFKITEIIDLHEKYDIALLRVATRSETGQEPPEPLPITSQGFDHPEGRQVYLSGYPAVDPSTDDPVTMSRIFNNIYDVKRLQPGNITSQQPAECVIQHDSSTLGGNSGSCVIDLIENVVIGLHFGGSYLKTNYAVALWQLANDPMLRKAGVNFV